MQTDPRTSPRPKKFAVSKLSANPLAKDGPAFREAVEASRKAKPAEIDADWDAKQKQRRASGMSLRFPTLNLVSRTSDSSVQI